MIELTREELIKEVRGERPDNATLFEDMLFHIKHAQDDKERGERFILRFDNGFGAVVFLDGEEISDTVYTVTWNSSAKSIHDYSVTHLPFNGDTNIKFSNYEEMRRALKKVRDYDPAPF